MSTYSIFFHIINAEGNEFLISEILISPTYTFQSILNKYFEEYSNQVEKIISRNTQEEFNLSDIPINLIGQSHSIEFILKPQVKSDII